MKWSDKHEIHEVEARLEELGRRIRARLLSVWRCIAHMLRRLSGA